MPGGASVQSDRKTIAALGKLDVLATIDITANPTTALSTHVFPAKDQLERADLPYALDILYPEVASQYTPALLEPPESVRSFWWILAQLGKRLGVDFLPGIDPDKATDEDVLARMASGGRLGMDALRDGGYVIAEPLAIGWLHRQAERIGGWRLAPRELVEQLGERNRQRRWCSSRADSDIT